MPTPQSAKDRSLRRRQRICQICEQPFVVRNAYVKGVACSKECLSKFMSRARLGKKQSPEAVAKRSAALRAWVEANPEAKARRQAAATEGLRKWLEVPENAAKQAKLASERMKRRHADPEWQKIRDERSSRVMKENWEKHRSLYTAQAVERYARHEAEGIGLLSENAKANKVIANRWIMKRASDALHSETNYNEVYADVQARIRTERPYVAAEWPDYIDYCSWCGGQVVNDPECRKIADGFLSQAIPRFAAEWKARKAPPQ